MEKERAEIPEPPGVTTSGVRYEAVPWGKARGLRQNGGYIAALDAQSGAELWLLKVYDVHYDNDMEDDKQDCFIARLSLLGEDRLEVVDERGKSYTVNLARREVAPG
jgi:hypothetical protein